jgi:predicted nucleic acid-binding protein
VTLFVDTSVWLAGADRSDGRNADAIALLKSDEALMTTDHVLIESWHMINGRAGHRDADRFWESIRSGGVRLEHVGQGDLETAWQIGAMFSDQDFSIVDRTSFAVMERLGVHRAASFDAHFSVYRFGPRRERAFTVVSAPA